MKKTVSIDYDELQLLYSNLKAFEEVNSDNVVVCSNMFEYESKYSYHSYKLYTRDELILKLTDKITELQDVNIKLHSELQKLSHGKRGWF
jgi:hypothetical protein